MTPEQQSVMQDLEGQLNQVRATFVELRTILRDAASPVAAAQPDLRKWRRNVEAAKRISRDWIVRVADVEALLDEIDRLRASPVAPGEPSEATRALSVIRDWGHAPTDLVEVGNVIAVLEHVRASPVAAAQPGEPSEDEVDQQAGFVENWIDLAACDTGNMDFQQTRQAMLNAQEAMRRLREMLRLRASPVAPGEPSDMELEAMWFDCTRYETGEDGHDYAKPDYAAMRRVIAELRSTPPGTPVAAARPEDAPALMGERQPPERIWIGPIEHDGEWVWNDHPWWDEGLFEYVRATPPGTPGGET